MNAQENESKAITKLNNILFYEGEKGFIKNFRNVIKNIPSDELEEILITRRMRKIIIDNNLFWSNFDLLEPKKYNLLPIIRRLSDENPSYFLKNFKEIIKNFNSDCFFALVIFYLEEIDNGLYELIKYLIENDIKCNYNLILRNCMNDFKNTKLIINNIDYFLKNNRNLLEAKTILSEQNMETITYDYIDNSKDKVVKEIINKKLHFNDKTIDSENIVDLIKGIIEELLEHSHQNFHDIEYIGSGGYTGVYKIGDKVLKIGSKRNNFKIDDNKRFLKPIYRQEIKSVNNSKVLLCIEITELAKTQGISHDDLYEIYKELRDEGLIWADAKLENLGILLKDNKIYFNDIEPSLEATGYNTKNSEVLKAGNIIITDNDYIYKVKELEKVYSEDIENIVLNCFPSCTFLERKYQRESKKKERVRK